VIPASDVQRGLFTFTPPREGNWPGLAAFSAEIDDGFGCGISGSGTITINVQQVNDPPSFVVGENRSALDTSGPQVADGWIKQSSAGPPNEASQQVHFLVTNDRPALFAAQPAINGNGKLTFEPAVGASGVANVSVVAVDDGGTANGGSDTSQPQTFTIGVALAQPLHNREIAADVTGDGNVVAEDAMDVINFIHSFGSGPVAPAKPGDPLPALYYDVTGDNYIAADDVIVIINYIHAHPTVNPEATELAVEGSAADAAGSDSLYSMLAMDSAQYAKRRKV
jgi:hypothetical protein